MKPLDKSAASFTTVIAVNCSNGRALLLWTGGQSNFHIAVPVRLNILLYKEVYYCVYLRT